MNDKIVSRRVNCCRNHFPEEVDAPEQYIEGASRIVSVNTYERSADVRAMCIAHHGYSCAACGFNFEQVYGAIGEKHMDVHHIIPLSERSLTLSNPLRARGANS